MVKGTDKIKNYEQELFFLLIVDRDNSEAINKILETKKVDYYSLLGFLCFNRLAGLAYSNVRKYGYYIQNEQFVFALENMYNAQKLRNEMLKEEICKINEVCRKKEIPFALLKGSILNTIIYGEGQRTSNDVDILINSKDITRLAEAVKTIGYIQGEYDIKTSKIIIPSRKEIIYRRMNWGEAYPFVKTFNSSLKYLEIDINFSISWVPEDGTTVQEMLERTKLYGENNLSSLSLEDFFIHLLMHLYKELILYVCVEAMGDLEFYKFVDIVKFLKVYSKNLDKKKLMDKVRKFRLCNQIYTALVYVNELLGRYEDILILDVLIKEMSIKGMVIEDSIIEPEKGKKYIYEGDIVDRLFDTDRVSKLREIK